MRPRLLIGLLVVGVWWASAAHEAAALAQQPKPQVDEFVPVNELPPEEQLPAAPLLIAAYAFVWAAVLTYLWFLWRRLGKVEGELADVAARAARRQ